MLNLIAAALDSDPVDAAALLDGILDSAMDAIITVDSKQRILLYNRAAEKVFGWPRERMLGEQLENLIPGRFRGGHAGHVERFGVMGVTSRRMGALTVVIGLRASGEEFPLDASISHLETPNGHLYTVILRDVTERVRAAQERSEFAAAALAIREEEKTRVARELHDELAQSLTALKMDTIWIRDHAHDATEQTTNKIDGMLDMLDHAVASTRRIAADLRPLMLDDLGLGPAIDWLASNFTQRSGVKVVLDVPEDLDVPEPFATAVFRIVQESLQNVAKHAQATSVAVSVVVDANAITLEVRDDGRGFSPQAARRPESLGLLGLHERAQLLKGSIEIDSAPGRGTRVVVRMPVNGEDLRP